MANWRSPSFPEPSCSLSNGRTPWWKESGIRKSSLCFGTRGIKCAVGHVLPPVVPASSPLSPWLCRRRHPRPKRGPLAPPGLSPLAVGKPCLGWPPSQLTLLTFPIGEQLAARSCEGSHGSRVAGKPTVQTLHSGLQRGALVTAGPHADASRHPSRPQLPICEVRFWSRATVLKRFGLRTPSHSSDWLSPPYRVGQKQLHSCSYGK